MKHKSILLLLPVTSLLLAAKDNPEVPIKSTYQYLDQVDSLTISAIEVGKVSEINIYLSFSLENTTHDLTLFRKNPTTRQFEMVKTSSSTKRAFIWKIPYVETIEKERFDDANMSEVSFGLRYTSGNEAFVFNFKTKFSDYETSGTTLRIYNSKGSSYYSGTNAYFYDYRYGEDGAYFNEHIVFHHDALSGEIEFDAQNYIDINRKLFKLYYHNDYIPTEFKYDEAYVYFIDKYNLFPNLHESPNSMFFYLRGEVKKEGGVFTFKLLDELYIDPLTRITYREKTLDRIKTNKLFLPLEIDNYQVDSDYNTFGYFIKGAGYNNTTIIVKKDLGEINRSLIGDCATSKYCVSSYVSEVDFELGKVEEINAQ